MKVGLVVRCDNRGLANQSWEVYRNLPHDKTLVIRDPGSERQGFKAYPERYEDGVVTTFGRYGDGALNEGVCREFLDGLDVVWSAETYYDWNFCKWARQMGVSTVLHANPEFYFHWREPSTPQPTVWWSATPWRQRDMPSSTRIVPMPVPIDRWPEPNLDHNPSEVLHIGGLEAVRDRNGTGIVNEAAKLLPEVKFLVNVQDKRRTPYLHQRAVEKYWDLYSNEAPIMLMPRKYGGLCLPAIEAIGAGKLVIMPDVEPNRVWPIYGVSAEPENEPLTTQGGDITLYKTRPEDVVSVLRKLFADEAKLRRCRERSYEWAVQNSWSNMIDLWLKELEHAADCVYV